MAYMLGRMGVLHTHILDPPSKSTRCPVLYHSTTLFFSLYAIIFSIFQASTLLFSTSSVYGASIPLVFLSSLRRLYRELDERRSEGPSGSL